MLIVALLLELGLLGGGAFLLLDRLVLILVALPWLLTLAISIFANGIGTCPWIVALAEAHVSYETLHVA